MTARDRLFEVAGLTREQVYEMEVLAADVQDDEVDRLVDIVRFDLCRLLGRLSQIRREEEAVR